MASILEDMLTTIDTQTKVNPLQEKEFHSNFDPLPGITVRYDDNDDFDNDELSWHLPAIRSMSQTGGHLVWQIGFDPIEQRLVRRRGYEITPSGEAGAINDDYIKIETNQSGRSIANQALLQAKKQYLDKTREGYSLPESTNPFEYIIPAQLACTYRSPDAKTAKKSNERMIADKEFERCPVACQVKIDGQRCRVINTEDRGILMYSRTNCVIDWNEHIREELSIFYRYLPVGVGIDGELQGSGVFEDTSSKIRQKHNCHVDNEDIKFYIFDLIVPEVTLEDRITILFDAFDKYRESHKNNHFFLLQHSYARSHQDIVDLMDQAIEKGYEGLMIRFFAGQNPNKTQLQKSWYKGKRNANLLKYKPFEDEEGTVIDIVQGKDRNEGAAIFVLRDPRGNEFRCVPHGTLDDLRMYYSDKEKYIGQLYTYKYQELTKYGIPRFPTGIRFRNYEGVSNIKSAGKS